MIAGLGLGLGLDSCWSRSRTMGLEKHPVLVSVLVSKKLSGLGLGLEACGLDYNTGTFTLKWFIKDGVFMFFLW